MSLAESADERKYLLMSVKRISGLPLQRVLFSFCLSRDRWDKEFAKLETGDFFSPIPIWTLGIANIGWGLQSALSGLEISFELGIASLIWVHRLVFSEVKSYTVQPGLGRDGFSRFEYCK